MDNFSVILENANFICYSMCRQTRNKQLYARPSENPESCSSLGFLLRFIVALNQANCRLQLSSNHLQMRWQTTPAMTATKNETNNSITRPPSCYQYRGGNEPMISLLRQFEHYIFRQFSYPQICESLILGTVLAPLYTFSSVQNLKKGSPISRKAP